jgi:hypothetical protein
MFDMKLMEQFYSFEDNNPLFDVDENVKNCYFVFIMEFCSIVAPEWKSYLKLLKTRDDATFKNILTRSDEAYAFWLLHVLYDKCKAQVDYIALHGEDEWNKI